MLAQAVARRSLVAMFLVAIASLVSCTIEPPPGNRIIDRPQPNPGQRVSVEVLEIVDGDTIRVELDDEETPLRLIGIDTPEKQGPYTDLECFGEEASRYTEDALAGRTIELEFDVERTDRFARTLAYVWIDGALFNELILRQGFAMLATFPPNVRYVDRFARAQQQARDEGAGLWGACPPG
jgi:micrococcal nuclease